MARARDLGVAVAVLEERLLLRELLEVPAAARLRSSRGRRPPSDAARVNFRPAARWPTPTTWGAPLGYLSLLLAALVFLAFCILALRAARGDVIIGGRGVAPFSAAASSRGFENTTRGSVDAGCAPRAGVEAVGDVPVLFCCVKGSTPHRRGRRRAFFCLFQSTLFLCCRGDNAAYRDFCIDNQVMRDRARHLSRPVFPGRERMRVANCTIPPVNSRQARRGNETTLTRRGGVRVKRGGGTLLRRSNKGRGARQE